MKIYAFLHLGPGKVRPMGEFSSIRSAFLMIGYPQPGSGDKFVRGEVSVVWSQDRRPFHMVRARNTDKAREVAEHRSLVAEAYYRMNLKGIMALDERTLRKLITVLPFEQFAPRKPRKKPAP